MARHLKTIALIVVCCFTLSLAGCAALSQTSKEHPTATGAAAGGVLGGAVGATAGGLIGGDAKSAIIGGLAGAAVGAITGAIIGKYMAKKTKSAEETAQAEGYATTGASTGTTKTAATSGAAGKTTTAAATKPAGTVVKLKAIEIEPSQVAPGETVKINFIYALLTPDPSAKTTVEESRAVHFKGEEIGTVTFAKQHTAGTWKTTVPIAMPSQAEPGTYVVTGNLKAGPQQTTETATFTVKPKM
jgi:hypothetical protein